MSVELVTSTLKDIFREESIQYIEFISNVKSKDDQVKLNNEEKVHSFFINVTSNLCVIIDVFDINKETYLSFFHTKNCYGSLIWEADIEDKIKNIFNISFSSRHDLLWIFFNEKLMAINTGVSFLNNMDFLLTKRGHTGVMFKFNKHPYNARNFWDVKFKDFSLSFVNKTPIQLFFFNSNKTRVGASGKIKKVYMEKVNKYRAIFKSVIASRGIDTESECSDAFVNALIYNPSIKNPVRMFICPEYINYKNNLSIYTLNSRFNINVNHKDAHKVLCSRFPSLYSDDLVSEVLNYVDSVNNKVSNVLSNKERTDTSIIFVNHIDKLNSILISLYNYPLSKLMTMEMREVSYKDFVRKGVDEVCLFPFFLSSKIIPDFTVEVIRSMVDKDFDRFKFNVSCWYTEEYINYLKNYYEKFKEDILK